MALSIPSSKVQSLYETLDTIGCLGPDPRTAGFLRAGYSDEETAAMRFIESEAIRAGATARWDQVKNLFLEWPGETPEYVEVGSHLDTIPQGGNFDGVAGIVAGLLAIQHLTALKKRYKRGLRLRIWRLEESATFNAVYFGSNAAFGKGTAGSLAKSFNGTVLESAMRSQGADPEIVRQGKRTISQEEVDRISAHIELHIEQGNLLEVKELDIGIVTSIRAAKRHRVVLRGEFDHSGATPMGSEYRKDVNLAMAYIQVELDKLAKSFISAKKDIIQTVGVINCNSDFNQANPEIHANAMSVISGFGYFTWEVRSNRRATLEEFSLNGAEVIAEVAKQYRVAADIQPISDSTPLEELDPRIQAVTENAAKAQGISSMRMPSGAGHDAAIVGAQKKSDGSNVPVGMVFIPCRLGKSHNPLEFTTFEAIAKGATVLADALRELAES